MATLARSMKGWQWVRDVVVNDSTLTIGDRIAEIRQALRWTQEDLGARIGVHQNAISVWEQGKNEPQAVYVYRLAQVWHTTMDGLYSGGKAWTPLPIPPSETGAAQCRGQKYLGVRCGRWTRDASGYCRWHVAQCEAAS